MVRHIWLLLIIGVVISGCTSFNLNEQSLSPTPTPTLISSPTPDPANATAIPTIETPTAEPEILRLWIPDTFVSPSGGDEATDQLSEQIAAFSSSENGVTIEIRRKQLREPGGIMPTLRTASIVAPGALPDLTLIRREDLLEAVQSDLLVPLEGIVSTAVSNDLFSTALEMGRVDSEFYGLPYALEIQHAVYNPNQFELEDTRFTTLLDNEIPFLFPAARATGLTPVFLVQYLDAGGTIDANNTLNFSEDALRVTLSFYQEATEAGLIHSEVANYTRSGEYRSLLTADDFDGIAVVSSNLYVDLVADNPELNFIAIPNVNGGALTAMDGWMWVMTTQDPNRQGHAAAFLDWMMDTDRQGAYIRSLNLLPSQRTAVRRWYDEPYAEFASNLIDNAELPLASAGNSGVARTLQTALLAVLNGEQTADSVIRDVADQLSN